MRSTCFWAFAFVGVSAGACTEDNGGFINNDDAGSDVATTLDGQVSFPDAGCAAPITIAPANAPTLSIAWGDNSSTQSFTATSDGQDVTSQVDWSFGRPDIGDVNAGVFKPTGTVGGLSKVLAKLGACNASAPFAVAIQQTIDNVSAQQKTTLDTPAGGPDPAAKIVYPYDQTTFPLGILGPEIQWNGSNNGDVYKLELKETYYDYVEYVSSAPVPSSHLLTDPNWASFAASGNGPISDPVAMSLTRAVGNTAYQPLTQTWHIAQGSLLGTIYYYAVPPDAYTGEDALTGPASTVKRIDPNGVTTIPFTPPTTWSGQGLAPNHCFGCHSVSRDGATMVASFQDDPEDTPIMGTVNLADGGLGTVAPSDSTTPGVTPAFDNTGNYFAFASEGNTPDGWNPCATAPINIMDMTGKVVAKNVMNQSACGEPAWSPDGTVLATTCQLQGGNCDKGWWWESTSSEIWLADMSGIAASNQRLLVPSTTGSGGRLVAPDFSSDSKWIVFSQLAAGEQIMSDAMNYSTDGYLWLSDVANTTTVRLDNASGDGHSQNPKYAPLRSGGYSWITFNSQRSYGNKTVAQSQLWIAAIDDPVGKGDPSHPAFYLRGQDTDYRNLQGTFRLPPCKADGSTCTNGTDCCGKSCVKGSGSTYTCEPDPGNCAQTNNGCQTTSDCCNPSTDGTCKSGNACVDGVCDYCPP